MHYETEQALIDHFAETLIVAPQIWGGIVNFEREFFYQRGKTDVIALAVDGCIIAFEAKLRKWREALNQAYRNTCFAHLSYVLLPYEVARRAIQSDREFTRRGVGVCTLEEGQLKVVLDARKNEPLQPWLSHRATEHISGECSIDC